LCPTAVVCAAAHQPKEAVMTRFLSRIIASCLAAALVPIVAWAGPVNINTADAKTLAKELDGIGPAKAQAIVDYRQKNGAFKSAEDLLKVEGIGAKVLEQNRENIRVEKGGGEAGGGKKAKAGASPTS
jgi:competence protein ComEA